MKIIKRSGKEDVFDRAKIIAAVGKANITVIEAEQLSSETIAKIASDIETRCAGMNRAVDVETIQDWVEIEIMKYGAFTVAKNYITYRYERGLLRQSNTTDQKILSLLNFEMKKSSRKIPIRIRLSTVYSVITWRAKSARTLRPAFCCPMILQMLIGKVLFISMMQTISHSTCTIAVWSIWRICCRTELLSAKP